jgi:hypothetical protein
VRQAERFAACAARVARIEQLEEQVKALKDENRADREEVLAWFRLHKPDGGRHLGLVYTKGRQKRLDVTLARQLLGARAAEAEKIIRPESLKVEDVAKAMQHPAARPLKSVGRAEREAS